MKIPTALIAVCLSLAASAAFAEDAGAFLSRLADGGKAEVAAGEVAAGKALNPEVRQFGMMMAKDHGSANEKIAELARSKGISLPATISPERMEKLQSLRAMQGAQFDNAYMSQMVKDHENTVKMLKSQIGSGQDADVGRLASELLPTVESHLQEAYRLSGRQPAAAGH